MLVSELLTQTRSVLQDADANYWTATELLDYYNSGLRSIASERIEEPTSTDVAEIDATNEYTVSGVLRYISIKDSNNVDRPIYPDDGSGDDDTYGVIILDYDRIYVNNPTTGVTLTIKNISLPADAVTTDTVRSGDDTALKYYMLSKAYEKEHEMENFQKSTYFLGLYQRELMKILNAGKLGYRNIVEITKSYFY
jgi:hypothetical protein